MLRGSFRERCLYRTDARYVGNRSRILPGELRVIASTYAVREEDCVAVFDAPGSIKILAMVGSGLRMPLLAEG